jgi:hypothetical protein
MESFTRAYFVAVFLGPAVRLNLGRREWSFAALAFTERAFPTCKDPAPWMELHAKFPIRKLEDS